MDPTKGHFTKCGHSNILIFTFENINSSILSIILEEITVKLVMLDKQKKNNGIKKLKKKKLCLKGKQIKYREGNEEKKSTRYFIAKTKIN